MSLASSLPITVDIQSMRENYDTSNPVVAEIIKAKEERLKILRALNKQQEEEISSVNLKLTDINLDDNKFSNKEKKKVQKRKADTGFPPIAIRRSTRLSNSPAVKYTETFEDYIPRNDTPRPQIVRPPNDYGPIPGVEIGFHWETRMECSMYGVHRPTVAGIHGGPKGAYSIALSGGYPEDVDEGYTFIYTGAGGRDLKGTSAKPKNLRTAPQTKDQQLEGTNLSLVKSIQSKLPIRVIRGYKSPSFYAPETGYRYDGLYQVVKYWEDIGKTGHRIYRFKMERIKDQAPPPWEMIKSNKKKQTKITNFNNPVESVQEEEEEESKENLDPETVSVSNVEHNTEFEDNRDEKDVDGDIEKCIESLCKTALNDNWKAKNFQLNANEVENFPGF